MMNGGSEAPSLAKQADVERFTTHVLKRLEIQSSKLEDLISDLYHARVALRGEEPEASGPEAVSPGTSHPLAGRGMLGEILSVLDMTDRHLKRAREIARFFQTL